MIPTVEQVREEASEKLKSLGIPNILIHGKVDAVEVSSTRLAARLSAMDDVAKKSNDLIAAHDAMLTLLRGIHTAGEFDACMNRQQKALGSLRDSLDALRKVQR